MLVPVAAIVRWPRCAAARWPGMTGMAKADASGGDTGAMPTGYAR